MKLLFKGIFISHLVFLGLSFLPAKTLFRVIKYLNSRYIDYKPVNQGSLIIAKKTLNRIERLCPWKLNCVNRSVVMKYLLCKMKISSVVRLSIRKNKDNFSDAHAWVMILNHDELFHKKDYLEVPF